MIKRWTFIALTIFVPAAHADFLDHETHLVRASKFFDGFNWNFDARVRYEGIFDDTTGVSDRNRGRFSIRAGFTKEINPRVTVGFRLATGAGANPTSTFQSFDNAAIGKAISIDQAYLDVIPVARWNNFHVFLGKHPLPFRGATLIWDRDVQPEGASEILDWSPHDNWKLRAAAGQYFFEDNAAPDDPYMLAEQIGFDHALSRSRGVTWGLAAAHYHTIRPFSIDATSQSATNFPQSRHFSAHGYSILEGCAYIEKRVGRKTPLRLSGSWLRNLSAAPTTVTGRAEDEGWLGELVLGKITDAGTWEIAGGYRRLEADATLAQFVESDFSTSAGNTDIEGWNVRINYSPWKNTTIGVAAAKSRRISNSTAPVNRDRIHLTLGVKF